MGLAAMTCRFPTCYACGWGKRMVLARLRWTITPGPGIIMTTRLASPLESDLFGASGGASIRMPPFLLPEECLQIRQVQL